jgi:hypothetical protein
MQGHNGTPLTGWALAHRVGHAIQIFKRKDVRRYEENIVQQFFDATGVLLNLDYEYIPKATAAGLGVNINFEPSKAVGVYPEKFKKAATSLLTSRSGRMNLLNNLEFELFCELVAQYLVTVKVKLGSDNPEILKHHDSINTLMTQLFDSLVGEFISF